MREGWKKEKFEDVFDLQMGKTPSRDNPSYWDGTNTWVSISDMKDKKYISKSKEQISDIAVKDSGIKQVKKGTAIMSFKLSIGKTAIAEEDLFTNEAIMAFNVRDGYGITPDYIYYYLRGYKWDGANKAVMGATLNKKTIASNYFSYPSLPEQERIVAELDCLSDIIEKQKQQLKELDNLAQSIFYTTFGDPKNDNFGWGLDTIGNLCTLKSGDSGANNTSEGDLPYVKVGDMNIEANNPYITTSSTFVSRDENKKRIFPIGTTIFPKRGGAIYTNKKRLTAVEICCDLNTMGVIPKEKVLPQFIYHYFLHLDFGELCNGAAIPQLNNIDIAPLVICTPPLSIQQEFTSKVEAIEKQKEMIKQSIEETETLFNSRMDYYFN